jgi:PAS domain S-box-containing protein
VKVLLVADDPFVLDITRTLVAENDHMELCGAASTLREAELLAAATLPDVAIVQSSSGGASCVSAVLSGAPKCAVVAYPVEAASARAIVRAGASALVPRTASAEEIIDAMHRAQQGQASLSTEILMALSAERERIVDLAQPSPAVRDTGADGLYQAILASAPEGILVVDPQGKIEFTNPKADVMFGYEAGTLIGQQVELLLPEKFRRSHETERYMFMHGLRSDSRIPGGTLTARRSDGTDFPAEITLGPTTTEDGVFVTVIVRDRTNCGCVEGDRGVVEQVSASLSRRSSLVAAAVRG